MTHPLVVLDAMPTPADFYARYWNRQPFLVRGAIAADEFVGLIQADELAALALEDAPQSRMVSTAGEERDWACRYGPFDEDDFAQLGDANWSLLVQNVEQFHPDTSALLGHFTFAPRWLMDDIMVSYSVPGGSVGPHIDSYHVFLVQGQGTRRWKVGREAVRDEVYVEGVELQILKGGFDGDEIEVGCGDVLYLPPKFAHEGTTLEPALTFSVGFLGPKLSELYSGYGQYLSELEGRDERYVGDGLGGDSAGFAIADGAVDQLRAHLTRQLDGADFNRWLVEFFTQSGHEDFGEYTEREVPLSRDAFAAKLKSGASLFKPQYVKFAITGSQAGVFHLGFDNHSFVLDEQLRALAGALTQEGRIDLQSHPDLLENSAAVDLLWAFYNHEALEFVEDA